MVKYNDTSTPFEERKEEHTFVEHASGKELDGALEPQNFRHRSSKEKQEMLAAAQAADPGIRMLSSRGFYFMLVVLTICWCGGDNGMDGTVMSSINGMKQYQNFFHLKAASSKTGIVFGMYTIGSVCSFFPLAYLPDKIGRRWTIACGQLVLIIGALITGNARNMKMFIAGRFFTGLGCATGATAAKSYLSEITSPFNRGRCMALLNSFYYIGQIVASGIAVPLGRKQSEYAWRAPLFVQVGPACLNLIGMALFCRNLESPRWLASRGRRDEARAVLAKLHSSTGDINSPLIQFEMDEIEEGISLQGADKRWWDYRPLFRTGADRYRILLCFLVSCGGQLSGNGLITYYLTVLLTQAGITNQNRVLTLNFVNSVTSFIGALSGSLVVDHIGRRKLMIFGEAACMIGMSIVAGLLSPAGHQSVMRANAGITFIFLFMVFFSVGWTPLQGLYPAEVLSYEMRGKGLALQTLATQAVSCINTFGLPSALAALTWKTYIIFACFDAFLLVIILLFVVETKQLTLEEMDAVFQAKNPKQFSFELARIAREKRRMEKRGMSVYSA